VRAILDTSVLIGTDVPALDGELAISAAALAELHFGVLVTSDAAIRAERLRRLAIFERRFTALPVDEAVTASDGELAAAVVACGRRPRSRVMDLLIAATRTRTRRGSTPATPAISPAWKILSTSCRCEVVDALVGHQFRRLSEDWVVTQVAVEIVSPGNVPFYATAAANIVNMSPESGVSSSHVTAIGRSPSWPR
jgi:toxin FitB